MSIEFIVAKLAIDDLSNKLLEAIKKPTFIKNKDSIYIGCNLAFEKLIGVNRNKILGNTAFGISPISLAKIYTEADIELFATQAHQTYASHIENADKERNSVVFSKSIFLDKDDQLAGFIGSISVQKEFVTLDSSNRELTLSRLRLTKRELEVLHLITQGLKTKEIAKKLLISNYTAADHIKSMYLKLGSNNRVTAILAAKQLGII